MWTYSDSEDEAEPSRPAVRALPICTDTSRSLRAASTGLCTDTARDGAPSEGHVCASAAAEFCLQAVHSEPEAAAKTRAYGSAQWPCCDTANSARPPPIVQQSLHRVLCCACWLSALLWRVLAPVCCSCRNANIRTVSESASSYDDWIAL
jgi:hypothetical protein